MTLKFSDISAPTPTPESLAATYAAINARLDAGDLAGAVADWETARRACEDWGSLTHLRFEQDTADAARKAAMDYKDEISPSITNHETAFKQRLLAHPDRQAVEKAAGAYALRLWESDVTTFKPEIEPDLQEEAKLQSRYTALLSSAKIIFDGKETNLSGLGPYAQSLERDVRHRAAQARWGFFAENAAEFDEIYDSLVKVRPASRISWAMRALPNSATGACGAPIITRRMWRPTARRCCNTSHRCWPNSSNSAAGTKAGTSFTPGTSR